MDVKTAGRTVEIFEIFAQAQEPLSLSEIGRALNAPLSSCLYLVRALESRGYLYAVGARKHIYPTRKLFDIAKTISVGESWVERAEPILSALRDKTKETILLGKRQGDRIIYVAVYEGTQTIRYSSQVGDLKPFHASSIGKALLSALDSVEFKKIMKRLTLTQATDATITDRDELVKEIDAIRSRGYAITQGEFVADVMALARPVKLGGDRFGVAIAGPLHRMKEALDSHAAALIEACTEIENTL